MSASYSTTSSQHPVRPTTEATSKEEGRIWFRENERWELTWPIWHMLPRHERKALALKHGYKTIGEFEEYMTLQRGLTDSAEATASLPPYENALLYASLPTPSQSQSNSNHAAPIAIVEEEDDVPSDSDDKFVADLETEWIGNEELSSEELMELGGKILILPEEMLHRVFEWLPVDSYATLALVSQHWRSFTRTEAVYKRLCERLYMNQSKRRALYVGRFGNSYRTMLEKRPRVRAGGGVYVMKYSKFFSFTLKLLLAVQGTRSSWQCSPNLALWI